MLLEVVGDKNFLAKIIVIEELLGFCMHGCMPTPSKWAMFVKVALACKGLTVFAHRS
jgi:hypothetical protein